MPSAWQGEGGGGQTTGKHKSRVGEDVGEYVGLPVDGAREGARVDGAREEGAVGNKNGEGD
jgi:hypothetical protein